MKGKHIIKYANGKNNMVYTEIEKKLEKVCANYYTDCNTCPVKSLCDKYTEKKVKNMIFEGNNNSYIINGKDLNSCKGIESLNYEECTVLLNSLLGSEKIIINEHEVFLIPLSGYFGYSALVFKNQKHLYYADDFQLHHKYYYPSNNYDDMQEHTPETLKPLYIESLNNKIFAESQLYSADDYNNYRAKVYYVRNYYIQQFDYKSAHVFSGSKEEKELEKAMHEYKFFNPISFCYMKEEEQTKIQAEFIKALKASYESILSDLDKFRKAISFELANHEACITMEYQEAVNALGLKVKDLTPDQLRITKQELSKQIEAYC